MINLSFSQLLTNCTIKKNYSWINNAMVRFWEKRNEKF